MAKKEEEFAPDRESHPTQSEEEREALIEGNLRLVLRIANDFLNRGLEWDDLVAAGNNGLIKAADHYDRDRKTKFSTYSAIWIKQAMREAINESRTIREPVGSQLHRSRIRRVEQALMEQNGGQRPSDEELAKAANLPLVTVQRLRDSRPPELRSLNEIVGNGTDDGTEFGNLIEDSNATTPDQQIIHLEEIEQLLAYLDMLPPRERLVLRLRYGLDGEPIRTLDAVGKQLHCSNERIRQLQAQALERLRKLICGERQSG